MRQPNSDPRTNKLPRAVDPVSVSALISAPRELVFEYLADIANHAQFTDHYLVDWRLTRMDSVGVGAGARFRVKMPLNRFPWADVTFAEVEQPHRIVEVGRAGKYNRIRTLGVYELDPADHGSTRVRFTFQTVPATLSDRILESFGARAFIRRKTERALRRLRDIMEGQASASRSSRVTVAGG